MRVLDPGHSYAVSSYDWITKAKDCFQTSALDPQRIDFVKRVGPKYPGNKEGQFGTIIQEVLRVLIDRAKRLDEQEHWPGNQELINDWRLHIYKLEARAAYRHGRVLKRRMLDRDPEGNPAGIESDPTCELCGHIECKGECRAD